MADNNPKGFSFEEALGRAPATEPAGFSFEEALTPTLEPAGFSFEEALGAAPVIPEPEVEDQSFLRSIADVPLQIGMGATYGVRAITEAFGADNPVAKNLRGVEDFLDSLLSAQSKADSSEIARLMKEAEDGGFAEQVGAALKGISIAPIDFMANAVGTVIPAAAAGLLATAFAPAGATAAATAATAAAVRTAAGIGTGAIMGTGVVKGAIFETIEQELIKAGLTPEKAEEGAQEAQSYGGENLDQIALGTILGGWAAKSGLEPALAKLVTNNVVKQGVLKGAAKGAIAEAIPETAQGAQEQLSRNLAQIREERTPDVPLTRGVVGSGTLEGLAGGLAGAGVGAISRGAGEATPEPGSAPEWLPVIQAAVNADLGKSEEDIAVRAIEFNEIYGEDAMRAYVTAARGEEMVLPSEPVEELTGLSEAEAGTRTEEEKAIDGNAAFLKELDEERDETAADAAMFAAQGATERSTDIEETQAVTEADGSTVTREKNLDGSLTVVRQNAAGEETGRTIVDGEQAVATLEAKQKAETGADPALGDVSSIEIEEEVDPSFGDGSGIAVSGDPELGEGIEAEVQAQAQANNEVASSELSASPAGPTEQAALLPESAEEIKKAETRKRLAKEGDKIRNRQNRASSKFLTTLKNGVQKILANKKYTVQGVPYFATEEELAEYDYNQAIADIQSEFGDVAGLEEQVRDIAFMSDTDLDAAIDNLIEAGYNPQRAKEFTKRLRAENTKKIKQNDIITNLEGLQKKRIEQLADVINISRDPKLIGKAAQTEALAALQNPDISPEELAQAERAADLKNRRPSGAVPNNAELSRQDLPTLTSKAPFEGPIDFVETAEEAADLITKEKGLTVFEKGLAKLFKPILRAMGTKFVVVSDLIQIPDRILDSWVNPDGEQTAAGLYDPVDNVIYIDSVEGLDSRTMLHEMIHAGTLGVIYDYQKGLSISADAKAALDDMKLIMQQVGEYYQDLVASGRATEAMEVYALDTDNFNDLREFVTYGLTGPTLQTMLLNMAPVVNPQLGAIRTAFSNFADAVRRMIGSPTRNRSAFEDLIDLTGRVAAETIRSTPKAAGQVVQAKKKIKKLTAVQQVQAEATSLREFGKKNKSIFAMSRTPKDGLRMFDALSSAMDADTFGVYLPILTNTMLTRYADKYGMPFAKKVNRIIQDLTVYRNRKLKDLSKNLDRWDKLIQNASATSELLDDALHLSSLFDVKIYDLNTKKLVSLAQSKLQDDGRDIAKTDKYAQGAPTGLKSIKFELQQMSKNPNPSPEEQTEMDRLAKLFQDRETEIEEVFAIFEEMSKSKKGSDAVELYSWVIEEYRKDFEEHNALLMDAVRKDTALPGTEGDKTTPKGRLLADIVTSYQLAKQRNVYVPLMRFGKYAMRAKKGRGTQAYFLFESQTERNNFARKYRADNPLLKVTEEDIVGDVGESLREQITKDSGKLTSMFDQIDAMATGDPSVAEDLKDNLYQMYLLSLPEGNLRKAYLRRKGRAGFSNDAYRALVSSKLASTNQLSRIKYGKEIRTAISEGRAQLEDQPTRLDLSEQADKKGVIPKEKKEQLLKEIELRATTELSPPKLTGAGALVDRFSRLGTKAGFIFLMSSIRSALIQPSQLATFGFGTLHSEYGAVKTAAMAAKYMKNIMSAQALSSKQLDENGDLRDARGEHAVRNSNYVKKSPIKNTLQAIWDIGDERNVYGATRIHDVMGRVDPDEVELRGARGADSIKRQRPAKFAMTAMMGAVQFLERASREVFFMSAAELEYEKLLKQGVTGDLAIEAAATKAAELTQKAMFDYSSYNKPRIAKSPYGRMAYQFQNYRLQATAYIVRNFNEGLLSSDLNKEEKRKAAIRFYDTMGMGIFFGGLTGALGYTATVAVIEGMREVLRPDEDDDDADLFYDMSDPNNPLGLRNFDLYIRNSVIPRYFGPESSLAKMLGLEPETAELLARSVEVGPISALTDWNAQTSLSLDGLWFSDYGSPEDTYGQWLINSAFGTLFGPFGSVATNMADGIQMMTEGDFARGFETMSPGAIKEPMEAYRLSQEGFVTKGGKKFADAEYYDTFRLVGQAMGFGSTELTLAQKSVYGGEEIRRDATTSKTEIYAELEEVLNDRQSAVENYGANSKQADRAQGKVQDVIDKVREHNYIYFYNGITGKDLTNSMQQRLQKDGMTLSGFYMGDKVAPYIYPIIKPALPDTPAEMEKKKNEGE